MKTTSKIKTTLKTNMTSKNNLRPPHLKEYYLKFFYDLAPRQPRDNWYLTGNVIQETEQKDLDDKEETVARKLFREPNLEKINLYSVTIAILNSQADAWEEVLKENYGEPVEGKEKSHGKKFTIKKFGVESEKTASIYVTLWKKEKFSRSTILVDAKRNQTKSIEYVQYDFTRGPKSKEKCIKKSVEIKEKEL